MESHRAYIAGTDYRYSAACGAACEILCKIFNKLISVKLHIISQTAQYITFQCQEEVPAPVQVLSRWGRVCQVTDGEMGKSLRKLST